MPCFVVHAAHVLSGLSVLGLAVCRRPVVSLLRSHRVSHRFLVCRWILQNACVAPPKLMLLPSVPRWTVCGSRVACAPFLRCFQLCVLPAGVSAAFASGAESDWDVGLASLSTLSKEAIMGEFPAAQIGPFLTCVQSCVKPLLSRAGPEVRARLAACHDVCIMELYAFSISFNACVACTWV